MSKLIIHAPMEFWGEAAFTAIGVKKEYPDNPLVGVRNTQGRVYSVSTNRGTKSIVVRMQQEEKK